MNKEDLRHLYYKIKKVPSHAWYWLRCHTRDRYHILDLGKRNPLGYRWGWEDTDYMLLYACFGLLRTFVEDEGGLIHLEGQAPAYRELAAKHDLSAQNAEESITRAEYIAQEVGELYRWWVNERPNVEANNLEEDRINYKKDTEMLIRLIKVRENLWT